MNVLDFGRCDLIESWGSDERIIEAARMSTNKGFQGWGPKANCNYCSAHIESTTAVCRKLQHDFRGDEKLLRYLWEHKHVSPFECSGLVLDIQAPIVVIREWQRHRSIAVSEELSFSELSGRYTALPDLYYIPSIERLMTGEQDLVNKQSSQGGFTEQEALLLQSEFVYITEKARKTYEWLLQMGVARELARLVLPVNQYSRMRCSANVRGWLAFLELRLTSHAMLEIREYAQAVARCLREAFPRTYALFDETHPG